MNQIDKPTEYATLRQEILDSIAAKDNYIIAMYTITTAVLCVAFELQNPILFLIPYVILFAFQNAIATKNENMIAIAAYIAVCLEKGSGWESNNIKLKGVMQKGIPYKRLTSIWKFLIGRISSVQLGMLCSVSCTVIAIIDILAAEQICEMIESGAYIILSAVLYILIRIQTKNVLSLKDRREAYIKNLQEAAMESTTEDRELTFV